MQAQSLDCQRRRKWITCESNAVRAPYQRVQGHQPVVIHRVEERALSRTDTLESREGVEPSRTVLQTAILSRRIGSRMGADSL